MPVSLKMQRDRNVNEKELKQSQWLTVNICCCIIYLEHVFGSVLNVRSFSEKVGEFLICFREERWKREKRLKWH